MKRRILLTFVVIMLAMAFAVHPVLADDPPPACPAQPCVYVDPARNPSGNEDGTTGNPYDKPNEGYHFARAQDNGAYVIIKNPDGTWTVDHELGVNSGAGGLPFPKTTLYFLVAAAAFSLIVAGWLLQRRSQRLLR